jgi:hypothetical protein
MQEGSRDKEAGTGYSLLTLHRLRQAIASQKLSRPSRRRRYEQGDELDYAIQGVFPAHQGRARLKIERFVGGGFAGQVYRVKVLSLKLPEGDIPGLESNGIYALKLLVPARGFSRFFRNLIYAAAFQAPFAPQVYPAAARAGAFWQKFIRRGAGLELGGPEAVVDILATVVDRDLGSCGEISEWVDGRLWRFEVDDDLDARRRWKPGQPGLQVGSPEYRAKKAFMARLVRLLHDMGAPELARQYEWWTAKSQPNVLKRRESGSDPSSGHTAVDFRAGLALLPFLPMSPADLKLILRGLRRRRLVQFDRGDFARLERFMEDHAGAFSDMRDAFSELCRLDREYRNSQPDITRQHVRLLFSPSLWRSILNAHMTGLVLRRHIDEDTEAKLSERPMRRTAFYLMGLAPFLGRWLRRLWGHAGYREHYRFLVTRPRYLTRTLRARRAEALIRWLRAGRVTDTRAERLNAHPVRFLAHLPLSLLPPGLHRFLSDRPFAKDKLDFLFLRPLRLYFKAAARETWLRETIDSGERSGMLSPEEGERIRSRIKEPFIQKYLKSLAVHVCTVPVTQIVSVLVAVFYVRLHPELSWQEASLAAGLILGLFQITPVSPGSLVRGLYVTFLVIRERNFKDYNIAFFLSFFKYIGYLAFPIQMAYRYPDLARFMAGHWSTGVVHIVPVFGERGALLEHAVFDLFYNFPLTVRRRMQQRRERRSRLKTRSWHLFPCLTVGLWLLVSLEIVYQKLTGNAAGFNALWWAAIWVPVLVASAVTGWAGGAPMARRLTQGALSGAVLGWLYAVSSGLLAWGPTPGATSSTFSLWTLLGQTAAPGFWRAFVFALLAALTVLVKETRRLRG